MRSFRLRMALLAMATSIAVAGCGGGSSSPPPEEPPPPPPPPPAAIDFTTFVTDQFAATADDTDPEPVDDTDFEFNDEDNPDAFSGLLADP